MNEATAVRGVELVHDREIFKQLDLLEEAIELLRKSIASAEDQLNPVLNPNASSVGVVTLPDLGKSSSPLAERIKESKDSLHSLRAEVDGWKERIEL